MEIGRDVPGNLEYFIGTMDDLRIYERSLSAREINQLYQDDTDEKLPKPCNTPVTPNNPVSDAIDPTELPGQPQNPPANNQPPVVIPPTNTPAPQQASPPPPANQVPPATAANQAPPTNQAPPATAANQTPPATAAPLPPITAPTQAATTAAPVQPPIVTVLNPHGGQGEISVDQFTIHAQIDYVTKPEDVIFEINGQRTSSFAYDPTTRLFTAEVNLADGANIFSITGTNQHGRDNQGVMLVYRAPLAPPRVTIVSPVNNPAKVANEFQTIQARVENVQSKDDIEASLNGVPITNFTFDPNTGAVSIPVQLQADINTFRLVAATSGGRDAQTGYLQLELPAPIIAPMPPQPLPAFPVEVGQVTVEDSITLRDLAVRLEIYDHEKQDGDIVSV